MVDREELTDGIAARLKDLREHWHNEAGETVRLSHEELANRVNEKYGVSIHKDTLKFYEATGTHSRKYSNLGMKLETLDILADFYQVSVDYILGRDPYPLSDRAKSNLSRICATPYRDTLSDLLASAKLLDILRSLEASRLTVKRRIREVLETEPIDDTRLDELKTEMRHLLRDNADDMAGALRPICNYSALESAIKVKREHNRQKEEAEYGEEPEEL